MLQSSRPCAQVLYALTAGIAGYTSLSLYRMLGGTNWVRCVLMPVGLFCGPLLLTFMFLNTVAIGYRSTAALPFGTICIIVVLWALVTLPLTLVGAIFGKNSKVRVKLSVISQPVLHDGRWAVSRKGPHGLGLLSQSWLAGGRKSWSAPVLHLQEGEKSFEARCAQTSLAMHFAQAP